MKVHALVCLALLPLIYGQSIPSTEPWGDYPVEDQANLNVPTGVWSVKYISTYTYTITPTRVLGGKYGPFDVKKSDNQKVFPTQAGWFKAANGAKGRYFYFRLTKAGTLKVIYFGPYDKTYKSVENYYGTEGVGRRKNYKKGVLGVWNVKYLSKYTYTITRNNVLGDPYSPFKIVMSDDQKNFPSKYGWFKAAGGKSGRYFYFRRQKADGTLRIIYFGPYKYSYNGLENYYGTEGVGKKKDFKKAVIGKWNVKYISKYTYTITKDSVLGDPYSPFKIVISDDQKNFPSKNGWFKAAGGKSGRYFYFRLKADGTLRIIYFGPYKYSYNSLENYYGTEGVGKKKV